MTLPTRKDRPATPERPLFRPVEVYIEHGAEDYPLGRRLADRYRALGLDPRPVEDHNRIPELRARPDAEFAGKKRVLVIGLRKSLRLVPNRLSADYIVPFTSSGCSAMCLYCYLTCTFFSNAYLRLFVNREDMWRTVERRAERAIADRERGHEGGELIFEIGANSDMLVDESLTGNLAWAVERFAGLRHGRATFATKFARVDSLLNLAHRGRTRVRVSVNPRETIRRVELGTAALPERLRAANLLHQAGYEVGINLAPVILDHEWKKAYAELLDELDQTLSPGIKERTFFEVIFMTYGLATREINRQAFPNLTGFARAELMRPKGRGKLRYAEPYRAEAETWFREQLARRFPSARLTYIC